MVACGRLCVAFAPPHARRLGLELLPGVNLDPSATPFTHNFDARYGITTGISAFDRARTIRVCADPTAGADQLVKDKGHVDGLIARPGGVLVRAGHTEGSAPGHPDIAAGHEGQHTSRNDQTTIIQPSCSVPCGGIEYAGQCGGRHPRASHGAPVA